eukprot:TRINITY_DN21962_c0_g1_i1.p1 TRINITY_DN21962_c0_g1~~TRINITY_DN21962_c0_g1_i1.p1  ORF type:complete len:493 (-),score=92.64 TRINITY_DN21962_c0_g1_i1:69-1547(-)
MQMQMACEIQTLVVHAAWHAANERSLLWSASAKDLKNAEDSASRLALLMPEEHASAIKSLAFHAAWYTANTRRFLLSDAQKDHRAIDFYSDLLTTFMPADLAAAIKDIALHAAWHAANTRSMFWSDAARDAQEFEKCVAMLPALLGQLDQDDFTITEGGETNAKKIEEMPEGLQSNPDDTFEDRVRLEAHVVKTKQIIAHELDEGDLTETSGEEAHVQKIEKMPERAQMRAQLKPNDTFEDRALVESRVSNIAPARETLLATPTLTPLQRTSCILDDVVSAWHAVAVSDDGVSASGFTEAAFATIVVFDSFGKVLSQMKQDMRGNIDMITNNLEKRHGVTLEVMIDEEATQAGSFAGANKHGNATTGVLWLTRALRLLERTLIELVNDCEKSLSQCVRVAYESTLKPHHNWLTRNVVSTGLLAAPSRSSFMATLSADPGAALSSIQALLEVYSPVLCRVHSYLCTCGLEHPDFDLPPRGGYVSQQRVSNLQE